MNHFCIIGIRPLSPINAEENPVCIEHAHAIQKALWQKNNWHYFYQGYNIEDNLEYVDLTHEALRDFSLYDTDTLKVSVCAVVGKNGSGKSSMIDLLIRMINNLSAVLLGENFNFAAAEHLHFIDYVYAELAIRIGNVIYILEEQGRSIKLHKYYRDRKSGRRFNRRIDESEILLDESTNSETIQCLLKKHKKGRVILKSLFYTLVCNYSLYGFNYRDYYKERTPIERLQKLFKKELPKSEEDQVWLKGIFHKNDGYQTPIVLHPMRQDGILNINKENHLAKERMCNLLFYKDGMGNYPQRIINGNLQIKVLKLTQTSNRKYSKANMLRHIGIGKQQNIYLNFDNIYNWIIDFWDSKYDFKRKEDIGNEKLLDDAFDYIVYKTLKIVSNYKKYHPIYTYLSKKAATYAELCVRLHPLYDDFTHITKKLLRTIMYLKKDIYLKMGTYTLDSLDEKINASIGESIHPKYKLQSIDLLPPPIFDQTLYLQKDKQKDLIDFRNLSSGEKQIAYTISNFMYHLVNVDSEWNDYYRDTAHMQVIKYKYVNVIFDEVELYFHPELQRSFMGLLQQALQNAHFTNLRGINIMLVTHSPFILSDIPHSNVLCMGEKSQMVQGTLGANIIELLGNSFFLSSVIGNVVTNELKLLIQMHDRMRNKEKIRTSEFSILNERFKYLQRYISEPYLQEMSKRMYNELVEYISKKHV